ncbi:hypothetical protein VP01_638g1 [Puccinia sorghi]|uniref:Uncharacterized protein n=1 Tax=Puccinia sorghi TaxID=27349 RepID=A0A0L6UI17_9BASI|nr:hypothetical protein VP01_638g1 [Puccinia sorghi]
MSFPTLGLLSVDEYQVVCIFCVLDQSSTRRSVSHLLFRNTPSWLACLQPDIRGLLFFLLPQGHADFIPLSSSQTLRCSSLKLKFFLSFLRLSFFLLINTSISFKFFFCGWVMIGIAVENGTESLGWMHESIKRGQWTDCIRLDSVLWRCVCSILLVSLIHIPTKKSAPLFILKSSSKSSQNYSSKSPNIIPYKLLPLSNKRKSIAMKLSMFKYQKRLTDPDCCHLAETLKESQWIGGARCGRKKEGGEPMRLIAWIMLCSNRLDTSGSRCVEKNQEKRSNLPKKIKTRFIVKGRVEILKPSVSFHLASSQLNNSIPFSPKLARTGSTCLFDLTLRFKGSLSPISDAATYSPTKNIESAKTEDQGNAPCSVGPGSNTQSQPNQPTNQSTMKIDLLFKASNISLVETMSPKNTINYCLKRLWPISGESIFRTFVWLGLTIAFVSQDEQTFVWVGESGSFCIYLSINQPEQRKRGKLGVKLQNDQKAKHSQSLPRLQCAKSGNKGVFVIWVKKDTHQSRSFPHYLLSWFFFPHWEWHTHTHILPAPQTHIFQNKVLQATPPLKKKFSQAETQIKSTIIHTAFFFIDTAKKTFLLSFWRKSRKHRLAQSVGLKCH